MPTSFAELPTEERMTLRRVIEDAGGEIEGYQNDGVQVAIPNPSSPFFATVEARGFELVPGTLHLFPLGSDKPPARLRHACHKYGDALSFWLFGTLKVKVNELGAI